MRYALLDIDLADPLPADLPDGIAGAGVLVRVGGRPASFGLEALRPGERPGHLIARLVARDAERHAEALLLRDLRPEAAPVSRTLTVAMCTKDHPDLVARCLERLTALRPPWAEILVIDNAPSSDATREVVASFPGVGYAREPVAGLDVARNRALALAATDWLAFIDDDAVPDHGYFEGIARAWAEHPDAGGLTGLVLPYELESEAQILFEVHGGFGRGFTQRRYGSELAGNPVYPCGAGSFGAGCNMAFSCAALRAIDGFDVALDTGRPLPGGGDLDIYYRIVRAGHVMVYEPGMAVFHQHRADLPGLKRQYWSWGLGFMAFVVKNAAADPAMKPQFRALLHWWTRHQAKRLAKAALGRGKMPFRMVAAETWGGIRGYLGEYRRSQARMRRALAGTPS